MDPAPRRSSTRWRARRRRQAAAAGLRLLGLGAGRGLRGPRRGRRRGAPAPSPRSSSCTPARWCTTTSWTARPPAAAAPPRTSVSPPGTPREALAGDGDVVRHGSGDPDRRPRAGLVRRAAAAARASRRRRWPAPAPVWDTMRTEVTAGQYLDLLRAAGGLPGPGRARCTVARYKSAGYTVQRPLQPGAAIAGAGAGRAGRVHRDRAAARRGLPAPGRRPRRVRGSGGHRQVRRRRPARGQADPADRPGGTRTDGRAATCSRSCSVTRTWAPTASSGCRT